MVEQRPSARSGFTDRKADSQYRWAQRIAARMEMYDVDEDEDDGTPPENGPRSIKSEPALYR